jgi:hypothetical protein
MKNWLLMNDIKNVNITDKSWVTVLAYIEERNDIDLGYDGYQRQYDCISSIIIKKKELKKLPLLMRNTVIQSANNRPSAYDRTYERIEEFDDYHSKITGEYFIYKRNHPLTQKREISISQDFIYALDLFNIGDNYYDPHFNDELVIRIENEEQKETYKVDIRKDYLLDYLSARNMSLIVDRYFERQIDTVDNLHDENIHEEVTDYSYALFVSRTLPNGMRPGDSALVMKVSYKDVDYNEDIPEYDESKDTQVEQSEIKYEGEGINHYLAEFRRIYILQNNGISIKIRRDKIKLNYKYYVDNTNKKVLSDKLITKIQFLWFKPDIIKILLQGKYCGLRWFTKDTCQIGNIENNIWLGVNRLGLINVFAKDIIELPEYYQSKWFSYNCPPNGGVSQELLMSQIEASPANTKPSEYLLKISLQEINKAFLDIYLKPIFKETTETVDIDKQINRFQSVSQDDCFVLCKNINRYIIERFNSDVLTELSSDMEKRTGSLKRLEHLLSKKNERASKIISPLFIIYDMRIIDAHYTEVSAKDIFKRFDIEITETEDNYIRIAEYIIYQVAKCLHEISVIIRA